MLIEDGKDGTVWTVVEPAEHPASQNELVEDSGPTPDTKRNIYGALTAFLSLINPDMLKHIRECTVAEAHRHHGDCSWDMTVAELKAFIGLLYIRGAQGAQHMDPDSLWSEKWGFQFFKETMSRNRFKEIVRFLSFDEKETRRNRLANDRFALISATWNNFAENCIACYKPGANITIDERLFPTKARCKFIQHSTNKPGISGIKFWLAVDVESKYMLNGAPYLRKKTQSGGQPLEENVVLKVAEPFMEKGRNMTTDSFFTSLKLATTLQAKKTNHEGSPSEAKQELPRATQQQAELKCGNTTVIIYQGKPHKSVCILSTAHPCEGITDGLKTEPVQHYKNMKYSVDILDQKARKYSVKFGTRRWPIAVFYNILDLAGVNAHILFQKCLGIQIPQRRFLQLLGEELRTEFMQYRQPSRQGEQVGSLSHQDSNPLRILKRKTCQIRRNCSKNKTSDICCRCHKAVCGGCGRRRGVICALCESRE